MFAKKISQSMIDAVNKAMAEEKAPEVKVPETPPENKQLDEAAEKVATPTGMKVYGSSYGNSAKAKRDQTKSSVDTLKGPKDKEMKEELKGDQDKIDANKNNKIDAHDFALLRGKKKVKEGMDFANKLLEMVRKSDVPAYLRKAKGDTPLTVADVKAPKKDSISAPENLAKARNEEVEELDEAGQRRGLLGEPDLVNIPGPAKGTKPSPKAITKGSDREYYKAPGLGGTTVTKWRKKVAEGIELTEEQLDEMINEVLGKDASAGDWIHDFVHSDNPKFAGKSKAERKKMALGAYYGKQNENVENADAATITTDTLAGRMPGGKINSFKSYKLRVKPLDKEGDGEVRTPDCSYPEKTAARASIKAEEVELEEKVIAGTPGWEKSKKDVKDKSGAVHTPMSRARDLAQKAFKKVKSDTSVK